MRHGVAVSVFVALLASGLDAQRGATPSTRAMVVSTRADMVTGGDALVDIAGAEAASASILINGRDVTSSFRIVSDSAVPTRRGRVEGLSSGVNSIEVRAGTRNLVTLQVTNHSRSGPVFSGPHQKPFLCSTLEAGLGQPLDANCSVNTVISYVYKSTDPLPPAAARGGTPAADQPPPAQGARGTAPPAGRGRGRGGPNALPAGFKVFTPGGPRPADVAKTTTTLGKTVDYIVRRERGTINRAIYEIALLHVPGEPLPDPWKPASSAIPGWNGRLVYTFGGGCAAGYRQGPPSSALIDALLSAGYASAASSLNVFGTNCDDLISAESLMMVKEYFIEQFGVPVYTIGNGGSGGSMQQHLIAQNYPGLLDGLTPSVSFPDGLAVWSSSADCSSLSHAFEQAKDPWTEDQKRAVGGFATWRVCGNSWTRSSLQVSSSCPQTLADNLAYDPKTNPAGARCSTIDNEVNSFGKTPGGATRSPLDNVGVQYGLVAFNAGQITATQFVELNEKAGGHDLDGNNVPQRTAADPEGLRLAYTTGRLQTGGGSLGSIPILDTRGYSDPTGDIHDSYRSFVTRARIAAANNGRATNHVIFRTAGSAANAEANGGTARPSPFNSVRIMDGWLEKLAADRSNDPIQMKIDRARPPEAVDTCWSPTGEKIVEPASYTGKNRCNELYPPNADPRIAAGAPLTDDVLKCQLKPIDPKDYRTPPTAEQMTRLRAVFPAGVCDYSKPGVGQRVVDGTWKRY